MSPFTAVNASGEAAPAPEVSESQIASEASEAGNASSSAVDAVPPPRYPLPSGAPAAPASSPSRGRCGGRRGGRKAPASKKRKRASPSPSPSLSPPLESPETPAPEAPPPITPTASAVKRKKVPEGPGAVHPPASWCQGCVRRCIQEPEVRCWDQLGSGARCFRYARGNHFCQLLPYEAGLALDNACSFGREPTDEDLQGVLRLVRSVGAAPAPVVSASPAPVMSGELMLLLRRSVSALEMLAEAARKPSEAAPEEGG